jgi:hypothetical protein
MRAADRAIISSASGRTIRTLARPASAETVGFAVEQITHVGTVTARWRAS